MVNSSPNSGSSSDQNASHTEGGTQSANLGSQLHRFQNLRVESSTSANKIDRLINNIRDEVNILMHSNPQSYASLREGDLFHEQFGATEITSDVDSSDLKRAVTAVYNRSSADVRHRMEGILKTAIDTFDSVPASTIPHSGQEVNSSAADTVRQHRAEVAATTGATKTQENTKPWYKRGYDAWEAYWKSQNEHAAKSAGFWRNIFSPKSGEGSFNFFSGNFFLWRRLRRLIGRSS